MEYGAPQVRMAGSWTKTVGALVAVNVVVFLAQSFAPGFPPGAPDRLSMMLGLLTGDVYPARIYTLLTYAFLHGGPFHLLFNMLTLYMFGGDLQLFMGTRRFLVLYFGAALAGGLAGSLMPPGALIVGASGALFGLLTAYAVYFPHTRVLLFFVIPAKIWFVVVLFMALSVYFIAVGGGGQIAHLAHLGGGLFGLLYVKRLWKVGSLLSDLKYRWRRRHFRRVQ